MAEEKFVIVSTFTSYDANGQAHPRAGMVFGPYDSKEEAQKMLVSKSFPYPEHVYIRRIVG